MNEIKFATPDISKVEIKNIGDVTKTRWLTNGPEVRAFEKRIAKMSECDRAVAFDSCTGAMEMALRVLGIGAGDEVITTPYTYTATAEVIRNTGATIVFVDLDGKSFEMDYAKVAAAITDKTKAVMPVDIGGKLCDYECLMSAVISQKEKYRPNNEFQEALGRIAIVADAAHSFGATRNGKASGMLADFTCFSFHVLKNITTGGEGGALVWRNFNGVDNDRIEEILRLLGDHGQTSRDKTKGWEYDIALFGFNSIMTNIDAAMGNAQLDRYYDIKKKRIAVTRKYDDLFEDVIEAKPLIRHIEPGNNSAMHLYPIRLHELVGGEEGRNKVYHSLKAAGIPCNVHYKPLPMMTAYKNIGFDIADFPNAYAMFKDLLTIPYHTELTESQQEYIVEHIRKAVREL